MSETINTKPSVRSRGPGAPKIRAGRAALLVAAVLCLGVLLAACGGAAKKSSGSSGNSSSAARQASSSSGSSASGSAADSSKAAKFSQCMRANGVPDFPDPNANGQFELTAGKGSDLNPNSSGFQSAVSKCKSLEPAGTGSNSAQSTGNQNKILRFVDCMRKNGVAKFPDPNSSGGVLIQSGNGIDPNSPTFQAAMQKCQSLLPAGSVGP